ncbi:MAG: glycosyltransferase family 2 protein [Verrucomicrobiae bacterium]|nr:glycosyltransferase family 2 protein [Verrucomicrobiae bacterium]
MAESLIAFIPAYNEAATIAAVVARTRPYVKEVVVVDDGSQDQTAGVARAAGATVLVHPQNLGKGTAIATALKYFLASDAAMAVFLDADGQHAPEEIPKFAEAACSGAAALVVGNRMGNTQKMPLVRLCANRLMSWLISCLAGQGIPDSQCGFRLLRRELVPALRLRGGRFDAETEMLIQAARAGHKIVSVPIRTIYDPARRSRIRPVRDTVRFLRLICTYWR